MSISLSLSIYIYIYIYIHTCIVNVVETTLAASSSFFRRASCCAFAREEAASHSRHFIHRTQRCPPWTSGYSELRVDSRNT